MAKKNHKATFWGTFGGLFAAIFLFLAFRWIVIEPFVIPSGSMIPTLLINDHIFVNKLAFGIRVPYMTSHLFRWGTPKRGDVIVFVGVEDPSNYLIKRVIGLPGELVEIESDGNVKINGQTLQRTPVQISPENLKAMIETKVMNDEYSQYDPYHVKIETKTFLTLQVPNKAPELYRRFELGPEELFVMGDNRDHSQDSRFFGPLPMGHLVGRAMSIWLSCDRGLQATMGLCNENELRADRFFKVIE